MHVTISEQLYSPEHMILYVPEDAKSMTVPEHESLPSQNKFNSFTWWVLSSLISKYRQLLWSEHVMVENSSEETKFCLSPSQDDVNAQFIDELFVGKKLAPSQAPKLFNKTHKLHDVIKMNFYSKRNLRWTFKGFTSVKWRWYTYPWNSSARNRLIRI